MNQPEALRLADWCDTFNTVQHSQCAAELRRLHAKNERIYAQHASVVSDYEKAVVTLKAQRDALMEALAVVLLEAEHTLLEPTRRKARAAIKAAEGETK